MFKKHYKLFLSKYIFSIVTASINKIIFFQTKTEGWGKFAKLNCNFEKNLIVQEIARSIWMAYFRCVVDIN